MPPKKTSPHNKRSITLLCKIVDNFGDIGVVYRLANALSESSEFSLRLVVSDLSSFSKIAPKIDAQKDFQTLNGYQIFRWTADTLCLQEFQRNPPDIIIECFQCGRPEWLEHLLFDVKFPHITHIIMLDYLTAENYAEDFHLLPSITRSARVKKVNFMPGFTKKTGGLILDTIFYKHAKIQYDEGGSLPPSRSPSVCSIPPSSGRLCLPQRPPVLFFSYEKNLLPAVRALKNYNLSCANGNLSVLLANGAGFASFKNAYTKEKYESGKEPFSLTELPFLPQEEWDCILYHSQILFIRGEDSLSRACLSGTPFVWNAYPQSDDYQLIKVNALLEKLHPFFDENLFAIIKKCWNLYNETDFSLSQSASLENEKNVEEAITDFLFNCEKMQDGFKNFSKSLVKNGDLTHNLMTFILKNTTIVEKS
ncbi:MAG: elongation factor P maturation arginine rhamnosyltransferase EarP [Treponema sp.]|nr:elongation factor P maturation arginine rhamnosyltransferase EarP [Treponema sp.]